MRIIITRRTIVIIKLQRRITTRTGSIKIRILIRNTKQIIRNKKKHTQNHEKKTVKKKQTKRNKSTQIQII